MDTILVVEDDKDLRRYLKGMLERHEFIVFDAANARRAVETLKRHDVDLILMDLRLPDTHGLDVIRRIREITEVPVIIVSGEANQSRKLNGFDLGADDYVAKPFDPDELIARIKAQLRRYRGSEAHGTGTVRPFDEASGARFGRWTLDRAKFQMFDAENNSGNLTVREYHLLDALMRSAGRPLTRETLCEAIREANYVPSPRAIDIKISRIRKKIGDDAGDPQFIKTVRGIGYVFHDGRARR